MNAPLSCPAAVPFRYGSRPSRSAALADAMDLDGLRSLLAATERPVLLLEGTRRLPEEWRPALTEVAALLARELPEKVVFRTGNAEGSDEAFAEGVVRVDAERLQYVLPYAGHRFARRPVGSYSACIGQVEGEKLQEILEVTGRATPHHRATAASYQQSRFRSPRDRAVAQLILRDTLKVTGDGSLGMAPATAGIFFVNALDPLSGGTGHTLRVCREYGVPALAQEVWSGWMAPFFPHFPVATVRSAD